MANKTLFAGLRDALPSPCAARSGTHSRDTGDLSFLNTSTPSAPHTIRIRAARSAAPGVCSATCRARMSRGE